MWLSTCFAVYSSEIFNGFNGTVAGISGCEVDANPSMLTRETDAVMH